MSDLLSLVAKLKEVVERLRTIRKCEQEIDLLSISLRERHWGDTPQTVPMVDPPCSHSTAKGASLRGGMETGPSSETQTTPILTYLGFPGTSL